MIALSEFEAAAVFHALIPDFRPNGRGHYRGPAIYRGGDNRSALSVDLSQGGRYFDHVANEGGDTVDYVRKHLGCRFREAAGFISEVIGREVLEPRSAKKRPRFDEATLANGEQFRRGFIWRIEAYLATLKDELWKSDEPPERIAKAIRELTDSLADVQRWSGYKTVAVMRTLQRRIPDIVQKCIEEGAQFDRQLAIAIVGAIPREAAA